MYFSIGAVGKISGLLPSLPVPATWAGGGRKHPSQVQVADFSPAGQPASAHGFPRKKVKFPLPGTYFSLAGQPASAHGFPGKKVKLPLPGTYFSPADHVGKRILPLTDPSVVLPATIPRFLLKKIYMSKKIYVQ